MNAMPPRRDPEAVQFIDDEHDPAERSAEPPARSGSRLPIAVAWLLAAGVAGGAVGFVLGQHQGSSRAPAAVASRTAPKSVAPSVGADLSATDNRCSAQTGSRQLQLGFEILNPGATDVELHEVTPVFPLGGLQTFATQVGTCGQPATDTIPGYQMHPDSKVWITATITVLSAACPAPLPVQFDVAYAVSGQQRRQRVTSFSDLGNVPYTACR
jgi:hypothetical protein